MHAVENRRLELRRGLPVHSPAARITLPAGRVSPGRPCSRPRAPARSRHSSARYCSAASPARARTAHIESKPVSASRNRNPPRRPADIPCAWSGPYARSRESAMRDGRRNPAVRPPPGSASPRSPRISSTEFGNSAAPRTGMAPADQAPLPEPPMRAQPPLSFSPPASAKPPWPAGRRLRIPPAAHSPEGVRRASGSRPARRATPARTAARVTPFLCGFALMNIRIKSSPRPKGNLSRWLVAFSKQPALRMTTDLPGTYSEAYPKHECHARFGAAPAANYT